MISINLNLDQPKKTAHSVLRLGVANDLRYSLSLHRLHAVRPGLLRATHISLMPVLMKGKAHLDSNIVRRRW